MGRERSNRRIGGKKSLTHSPARSAALRPAALRSAPLRSVPLRPAPLRAAPLARSFVSEKVAMHERDHMRRYAQIQPIVRLRHWFRREGSGKIECQSASMDILGSVFSTKLGKPWIFLRLFLDRTEVFQRLKIALKWGKMNNMKKYVSCVQIKLGSRSFAQRLCRLNNANFKSDLKNLLKGRQRWPQA